MLFLSQTIVDISECSVSFRRIERFLLAEEIDKPTNKNRKKKGISISNGNFFWSEVGEEEKHEL